MLEIEEFTRSRGVPGNKVHTKIVENAGVETARLSLSSESHRIRWNYT